MIVLNLLSLLVVFGFFISLFQNKYIKIILSILCSLFFCLQLSSLYLGNSFIDYKYYVHFNIDTLYMAIHYKKKMLLFLGLWFSVSIILFFFYKICIVKFKKLYDIICKIIISLVFLTILLFTKNGIGQNLKTIYAIVGNPFGTSKFKKNFNHALQQLSDDASNHQLLFIKKENLQSTFGNKNIIIVSIESFEYAFLHDMNQFLTPHLRERMKQWNFYKMNQNTGSGWTAGSLYTVFTGFPCIFSGNGNSYFRQSRNSQLITFGDVLNQCKYETYHLSSSASFADTKDILTTFGIKNIIDNSIVGDKDMNRNEFGLQDKDIFTEAKNILIQRDTSKPFMLFVSTINTHSPDGIVDDRMLFLNNNIRGGDFLKTNLEKVALATDWLVNDFLSFIDSLDLPKNTVVFIFPDHLFMGEKDIFDKTKEQRSLWFMTNADKKDLYIDTNNFYQIDLLKNILAGAKIKHNAVFLSDICNISRLDKEKFIKDNVTQISDINSSSLNRENNLSGGFSFTITGGKLLFLIDNKILFEKNISTLKDSNLLIALNMELYITNLFVSKEEYPVFPFHTYIKVNVQNGSMNFEWTGYGEPYKITGKTKIEFNAQKINIISKTTTNYTKGVVNYNHKIKEKSCIKYLEKILKDSSKVIIISCMDDASIYFHKLNPIMQKTGLKKSLTNHFRWSYLSIFSNHKVYYEKIANHFLMYQLKINEVPIKCISAGFDCGNESLVFIDSQEYSLHKRGLNFAIYDTLEKKIVDAFNVDFFEDSTLQINR